MSETDFIRAIAARAGCGLLLDVNNVASSQLTNHGYAALDYLSDFPLAQVGEITWPAMLNRATMKASVF